MQLFKQIGLVFLLVLGWPAAMADENRSKGPYVAISAGASGLGLGSISTPDLGDSEHSGFVGKLSVGYWFSDNWGIAADYVELGKFRQDYPNAQFRGRADSYAASVLGRLPLGKRWALVGKVNLVRSEMKDDGSFGRNFDQLIGRNSSVVLPSIELNYHILPSFALTLELDSRGSATDKVDLGYVGLGAKYAF